jgi:hypothetical protein
MPTRRNGTSIASLARARDLERRLLAYAIEPHYGPQPSDPEYVAKLAAHPHWMDELEAQLLKT